MHLTKNFSLSEFTYSDTAKKYKINNNCGVQHANNLRNLCIYVLQPLRDYLKQPIKITSGYRCPELNKKVGGQPNSQHIDGKAADIITADLRTTFNYIKNNLPYDQLLYEYDNQGNTWIHVSYNNRQQAIDNYKAK